MDTTPDLRDDADAPDTIESGKRLVRQEASGVSLGDRIMARFYRLIWQTPLHSLRLKGRHPLKLAGVPEDPVSGNPELGEAMLSGHFIHRGEMVQAPSNAVMNTEASAAFKTWLHGFSWLRDLATQSRAKAAPVAETITRHWLELHADAVSEPAWRPDLAARRMLHWAANAPLVLASTDLIYRSAVLNHFARAGRHLVRTADRVTPGVPRITAWAGVVANGILIAGSDARRLFGEAGLAKALSGGLTSDGGSPCRSPDAQVDLVDTLVLLRAVYGVRKLDVPEVLEDAINQSSRVLAGMMLGDDLLSSWQGSVPGPEARAVLDGVGPMVRPQRQTREWGYQRLASGGTILLCDAAPPPLAHVTSNGCASTLAIEMSDGAQRIIVNCGGARAGGLNTLPDLSEGLRTTAAHSTLTLADSNSTAILKGGGIGKGVRETTLDRKDVEVRSRVEASHDGYLKRFGFSHQRSVALSADGQEIQGEDTLLPGGRKRKGEIGFAVRFHLAPGIEPSATADGLGALLRLPDGRMWQFRARGGALTFEESVWIGPEGLPHPTMQLVIAGAAEPGGATIGWIFKRAS